jgi:hypothetical protein
MKAAMKTIFASLALLLVALHAHGVVLIATELPNGQQANARGTPGLSFSANGRYISFLSRASNLVPNDTNNVADVFWKDLQTGRVECVSCDELTGAYNGTDVMSNAMTSDGNEVVFVSNSGAVVLKNMRTGLSEIVSRATGIDGAIGYASSGNARISGDGRFVVFVSNAVNLVPGDTNGVGDVFVRDRLSATTVRTSVSSTGGQGSGGGIAVLLGALEAQISDDGRYVLMRTLQKRLVPQDVDNQFDCYLRDQWAGTTTRLGNSPIVFPTPAQECRSMAISANGQRLALAHADPTIVPAPPLATAWPIFYRAPGGGAWQRVDRPNGTPFPRPSERPSLDSLGQQVVFSSFYADVVPGDNDGTSQVYLHRFASNETTLISRNSAGGVSDLNSSSAQISPDGTMVAYTAWPGIDSLNENQYLYIPDTPSAITPSGVLARHFAAGSTQWQLDFIGVPGFAGGAPLSCAFDAPTGAFQMPSSSTALPGQILVNALQPGRAVLLCRSGGALVARYELQALSPTAVPSLSAWSLGLLTLLLAASACAAGRK